MFKQSRLLIVDLNKAVVASMTRAFQHEGFDVSTEADAKKAFSRAAKKKPDAVIVDLNYSGNSPGHESLWRFSCENFYDFPVVLISHSHESAIHWVAPISNEKPTTLDIPTFTRRVKALIWVYKRTRAFAELITKEQQPSEVSGNNDLSVAEQDLLRKAGAHLEVRDLAAEDPVLLGQRDFVNLLESSFSTAQAATLLNVNESRIRQRLTGSSRSLYGIKRGTEWRIPSFQFEGKRLLPGIGEVIAKLDKGLPAISFYRWFTTPNVDLITNDSPEGGYSPRQWLACGFAPERIAKLAEQLDIV